MKGISSEVESDSKLEGEIARAAHPLITRHGGAILLEEVYCAVNRARGTKLVAPDEVYQAAKNIELKYPQGGVVYYCYPSGIKVLKDATLSDESISGNFEFSVLRNFFVIENYFLKNLLKLKIRQNCGVDVRARMSLAPVICTMYKSDANCCP